ncbi:MAG: hypothetical protein AB7G08_33060 [Hyphomicrobiaceae bacterium]
MSREDDVTKTLGSWLGKAKKLGAPPAPTESKATLSQPEPARGYTGDDDLAQLNFKIPQGMKKRIKQLAVRDNITLLVMLERMLQLYEQEHGKLGK